MQQLDELKDGRYQAAWKEIGDPADTQGWPRWDPARCCRYAQARIEVSLPRQPRMHRPCASRNAHAESHLEPPSRLPPPTLGRASRASALAAVGPGAAAGRWPASRAVGELAAHRETLQPDRRDAPHTSRSTRCGLRGAATRFDYLPFAVATHQDVQAALARPDDPALLERANRLLEAGQPTRRIVGAVRDESAGQDAGSQQLGLARAASSAMSTVTARTSPRRARAARGCSTASA